MPPLSIWKRERDRVEAVSAKVKVKLVEILVERAAARLRLFGPN